MAFSFFKKKEFFSASEKEEIVQAIHHAEKQTSGEVRVFVESKNYLVDPLERAKEIFFNLEMNKTKQRNAVLIYVAVKHREVALYADEGIYNHIGQQYWDDLVKEMISHFKEGNLKHGIVHAITAISNALKQKFPYNAATDKNELPDDIVFGK